MAESPAPQGRHQRPCRRVWRHCRQLLPLPPGGGRGRRRGRHACVAGDRPHGRDRLGHARARPAVVGPVRGWPGLPPRHHTSHY